MPSRVYGPGRSLFFRLALCALALLFLHPAPAAEAASAKTPVPAAIVDYLADPAGLMTVQDAASIGAPYRPFRPFFKSFRELSNDFNGAVWLRFTLSPRRDSTATDAAPPLHLDLGSGLPGVTRLFTPQRADAAAPATYWQAEDSTGHVIFPLPGGTLTPLVVYVRLDGLPDLWFKPVLVPAAENAPLLPLGLLLPGALTAAMLMQLLRFSRERKEWRLWAALLAGCGLVQFFVPALPAARTAYGLAAACAALAPGFALMMLSHTARHLFATPRTMSGADKLLRFYPVLGALIALAPLAPGYLWLSRYLPFWPFFATPLLLFAANALSRGLSGSLGFFCVCLMPIVGIAASLWETTLAGQPVMGATGGIWGLALGSLALALATAAEHEDHAAKERETAAPGIPVAGLSLHDDVFASLDRSGIGASSAPLEDAPLAQPATAQDAASQLPWGNAPESAQESAPEPIAEAAPEITQEIAPETTAGIPPEIAQDAEAEKAPAATPVIVIETQPEPFAEEAPEIEPYAAPATMSAVTHIPLSEEMPQEITPEPLVAESVAPPVIEPEIAALALAPESRHDTFAHDHPGHDAPLEETAAQADPHDFVMPLPPLSPDIAAARDHRRVFDLILLIRDVYDASAPLAERKNMGLTWFISPLVGRLFEGEAALLDSALRSLLRDLVDVSERGNVRLSVRRLPDSSDAGHLVFTIAEWDGTSSARKRNLAGLSEAWALADKTGGSFSVEHSPQGGTTVIFSAVLTPMDKPGTAPSHPVLTFSDLAAPEPEAIPSEMPGYAGANAASEPQALAESHGEGEIRILADYEDMEFSGRAAAETQDAPPVIDCDDCLEEGDTERDPLRIITADMASGARKRMKDALAGLPHTLLEAADPVSALNMYRRHPSGLVIVNADMPETDIAAAVAAMRSLDAAARRSPVPVLALVAHDTQAERLLRAGCTETLIKPFVPESLLEAAARLAPAGSTPDLRPAAPEEAMQAETATEDVASVPDMADAADTADAVLVQAAEAGAENTPSHAVRELPLLDLIITDIDPDHVDHVDHVDHAGPPPENAVQEEAEPACAAFAVCDVDQTAGLLPSEPPVTQTQTATEASFITPLATPLEETPPAAPPAQPGREPQEETEEPACEAFAACDVDQTAGLPPEGPAGQAQTPAEASFITSAAPSATVANAEQTPHVKGRSARAAITVPLPGENDSIFKDLLPLVPGLLYDLSDAMAGAAKGRAEKNPALVHQAAVRVAGKAATFGLTQLERIARCVERAAAADDIEPMECVLDDLENWVARYKESLRALHRDMQW